MIGGDIIRKFIFSDIHGVGNVYYSIMGYLDNISKEEDIILYINGDLFDRGLESAEVLLDVINRMNRGPFRIEYLGGNHELLMYECFEKRKKHLFDASRLWYLNGGKVTDNGLDELLDCNDKAILEVAEYISNLKIYHKFQEKIDDKPIVLVHAQCPMKVEDECKLTIADDSDDAYFYVWAREDSIDFPFRCRIGNPEYFSIVGHTANNSPYGYVYNERENYLNIDGSCSLYASGYASFDHVPLVEVLDSKLRILTFNNNNEIIAGNYFVPYRSIPISDEELNKDRKLLNTGFNPKKTLKIDESM